MGRVSKRHARGRLKKALKNSISWNLHRDKAIRTQRDKDEKKSSLNLKSDESRGSVQRPLWKASERKFNSATRVLLT